MTNEKDPPEDSETDRDSETHQESETDQILAEVVETGNENVYSPSKIEQVASKSFHWSLLIICSAVIVLSFLMSTSDDIKVQMPSGFTLPETCTAKQIFGVGCPGCGMTRAFINISHGRFARAWWLNPASFLMYGLVIFQIPYRSVQLFRLYNSRPAINDVWAIWYIVATGVVLITQWIVRLSGELVG